MPAYADLGASCDGLRVSKALEGAAAHRAWDSHQLALMAIGSFVEGTASVGKPFPLVWWGSVKSASSSPRGPTDNFLRLCSMCF